MYVVYPHNYYQEDCPYCRDCRDCRDSRDCQDCRDCRDCRDSRDCQDCRDCRDSRDCQDCRNFRNSRDCQDCRDFRDSRDCQDYRDCQDCRDCQDYRDINNASRENCPSYAEYKHFKEYENRDPCDYIKSLLCCESWKCKCEVKLYCEVTSRLTYELCMARNLCQVKEIIDSICCLFSVDSQKRNSLAKIIKAYGIACKKEKFDWYDCYCKEMMKK